MKKRDVPTERTQSVPSPAGKAAQLIDLIVVLSGPHVGEVHVLSRGTPLVIGRRDTSDIQIDDDGVSRRHCTIEATPEGATVRDLDSQNGTFINGEAIKERLLQPGERFEIGISTTLKFDRADEVEANFQRKMGEAAMREPLTGLYNRRHFEERFAAEIAAAQRHGRLLTLLLIDIDHFKRINDEHGHLAGDEVLKMIANVLKGQLRVEDVVARYGGEEFVVLARETDMEGAAVLAERLRAGVEKTRYQVGKELVSVTVSIGVTISIGLVQFAKPYTQQDLIAAADKALYKAKSGGRNRVVTLPIESSGPAPEELPASKRRRTPPKGS